MLLPLLLAAVSFFGSDKTPTTWYGPATAEFHVTFDGNPFDPDQNDVRVRFTSSRGSVYERLAYFDGAGFAATLVAPESGRYTAVLFRNGKQAIVQPDEPSIQLSKPLPNGFIRTDPTYDNRFRWDSGLPYYPLGIDLAWHNGGQPSLTDQIAKLASSGANWTRIWACAFDGKNPWWPVNDPRAIKDQLWMPALDQWAKIVAACDSSGLPFQMTLFHHGLVSSTVNTNWPDNPWNAAVGGFLKDPADFFTDPEARRRVKMWLRYAVARYGASPNLVGWELFNEVEWVDAMKTREADVAAWHKEMADYLRSIDPYHHLVTSSSTLAHPEILAPLDYLQPHTYPVDISASIFGTPVPKGKPLFYGEFGPSGHADSRHAMRDGIFAGILANQAGAAEFWDWDEVERDNLYSELTRAQAAIKLSDVPNHPLAHAARLIAEAPGAGELVIRPGGGWETARKLTFDLPRESHLEDTAGIPQYVQGTAHRDMFPEPLVLRFYLAHRSVIQINVGTVSKSGAGLQVLDRENELISKTYPAGGSETRVSDVLKVSLAPGPHELKISNPGPDWFTLTSIVLPGLGSAVRAFGMEDQGWMFVRLTAAAGLKGPIPVTLKGTSLRDGQYAGTIVDLDTGVTQPLSLTVSQNEISKFDLAPADALLILKRP